MVNNHSTVLLYNPAAIAHALEFTLGMKSYHQKPCPIFSNLMSDTPATHLKTEALQPVSASVCSLQLRSSRVMGNNKDQLLSAGGKNFLSHWLPFLTLSISHSCRSRASLYFELKFRTLEDAPNVLSDRRGRFGSHKFRLRPSNLRRGRNSSRTPQRKAKFKPVFIFCPAVRYSLPR